MRESYQSYSGDEKTRKEIALRIEEGHQPVSWATLENEVRKIGFSLTSVNSGYRVQGGRRSGFLICQVSLVPLPEYSKPMMFRLMALRELKSRNLWTMHGDFILDLAYCPVVENETKPPA